jgi:hypothetical protein
MDYDKITLRVNGQKIEINKFVSDIMVNTITAMTETLNLDDKAQDIEIKIAGLK